MWILFAISGVLRSLFILHVSRGLQIPRTTATKILHKHLTLNFYKRLIVGDMKPNNCNKYGEYSIDIPGSIGIHWNKLHWIKHIPNYINFSAIDYCNSGKSLWPPCISLRKCQLYIKLLLIAAYFTITKTAPFIF